LNNFPDFKNDVRGGRLEWGRVRSAHHRWWLNHIPRVAGRRNRIANNWWQYILTPDKVV
jgi:hypothetical protein